LRRLLRPGGAGHHPGDGAPARRAGVDFAVLGKGETCSGDPARRAGNEYLYYQLASENVLVLNEALASHAVDPAKRKKVVTACPHCFHTLFAEYPQLGGHYDVVHHTEFLAMLVREGRLPSLAATGLDVTFHDPCYTGRHHGIVEAPRALVAAAGAELREMPRHGTRSFCCGAGGAQFWKEEEEGSARVADVRFAEAAATGREGRRHRLSLLPLHARCRERRPGAGRPADPRRRGAAGRGARAQRLSASGGAQPALLAPAAPACEPSHRPPARRR
jgi:hypothetical protein